MSEERIPTLDERERHELVCLRHQVRQLAYPCSPLCEGYLREQATVNGGLRDALLSSVLYEALKLTTAFMSDVADCQARPERGDWGVECPLCMGELIEGAERQILETARSALAVAEAQREQADG